MCHVCVCVLMDASDNEFLRHFGFFSEFATRLSIKCVIERWRGKCKLGRMGFVVLIVHLLLSFVVDGLLFANLLT